MTRACLRGVAVTAPLLLAVAAGCGDDSAPGAVADAADDGGVTLVLCEGDGDCDDGNPCTADTCVEAGYCGHVITAGVACDDGDACTEGDVCGANGTCGGDPVEVPRPACARCTCDPIDGVRCVPVAEGDLCDDGDCCTPMARCVACDPGRDEGCPAFGRVCEGEGQACDDDETCTADSCTCGDDGEPVCGHATVGDGAPCVADPNACTTGDSCQAGACVQGPPADLDDGDPCTRDRCVKGEIVHELLNEGQCDDGDPCTQDARRRRRLHPRRLRSRDRRGAPHPDRRDLRRRRQPLHHRRL